MNIKTNNSLKSKKATNKNNAGITLIALVITIIVLLILAGVSISMLAGDNSILQRAVDAKEATGEAEIREKIQLAELAAMVNKNVEVDYDLLKEALSKELGTEGTDWTITPKEETPWEVTVKGKKYAINSSGKVEDPKGDELPTAVGTTPYYPSTAFHQLPGTGLNDDASKGIKAGLVITDAADPADTENPGNEYVWIEVPRTADTYGNSFNLNYNFKEMSNTEKDAAYTAIAGALRTYCTKDANDGSLIKDGTSSEGTYGKTSTYGYKDVWYDSTGKDASTSTNLSDTGGCGLTNEKYIELYNKMLQSVYEHGGFWIGRYEAGTTTARNSGDSASGITAPLSKIDLYPINWVTCSEAQIIAGRVQNIDTAKYTSSLMFGIQWDLVLRHLSNKGIATDKLTGDSSTWGNYSGVEITITRGKYWSFADSYPTALYKDVETSYKKPQSGAPVCFTTGAIPTTMVKQNIYDLAGNMFEWTLEKTSDSDDPCALRGGSFGGAGSSVPASYRGAGDTSDSDYGVRSSCHTLLE